MARKFNFNPGPSTLPLPALENARDALVDYKGLGYGVLEMSHRHKAFEEINDGAAGLLAELFGIPSDYSILFVGGGASTQFFHVPMNFLAKGRTGAYVNTGTWAKKAIKEAKLFGEVVVAASSEKEEFRRIPPLSDLKVPADAAYLHITSNETINGTQWPAYPDTGSVPLICDMSSDILSRAVDVKKFALIYAGAQKNLGPAGLTVVIIRNDLLETCPDTIPTMANYKTHAKEKSLYNTPPAFAIYVLKLVLEWMKERGGLAAMEKENEAKAALLYGLMDAMPGYFKSTLTDKASRSRMNVTLRLPTEDLEKKFIAEADKAGFVGLKGHRSVGGIRVSQYNAMPLEGIEKLVDFMKSFASANP